MNFNLGEQYNFLEENEILNNNIALLCYGGSHAYGTNIATSDVDIRGIASLMRDNVILCNDFETFVETTTDTTIYSLNKIIHLLTNANPNVIEMLGCKDEHYIYLNDIGKLLLQHKHLFLSKKCIHSFGGYSHAQLMRLKNNLARYNMTQPEKQEHIKTSMLSAAGLFEKQYPKYNSSCLSIYTDKPDKNQEETEIYADVTLKRFPVKDFKSMINEIANVQKQYEKTNHRNKKKDDLHLNKHMMHLIRLYIMCIDILVNEDIVTYREKEHDLLMDIRNGVFLKDGNVTKEFWDMLDYYKEKFKHAAAHTKLPDEPNKKEIDKLLIDMYEMVL